MPSVNRNAILIACLAGFLLLSSIAVICYRRHTAGQGDCALIYQDNMLIRTIPLTAEAPYTITIEGKDGAYNVIEIRDGAVGIIDASCPDGLCKRMGFISDSLMPVTCLPNHLVIRVAKEGQTESGGIDGIVY